MLSNSVVDAAERARQLESAGVDGLFTFENAHDVFFPLVAAAPVCSLDLSTNVAIAFPRSPMHLAHAAYDLHLLSAGRFRLGLGSQVRVHVERRLGARWGNPVAHMREAVLATKAILTSWQDGTPLDVRGEYSSHTLMTPAFNPGPNPYGVPKILVGALGPRMNEMAAEVADGILIMPFNSERHLVTRTLPAIEAGLATAGRDGAGRNGAGRDGAGRDGAGLELIAEVIVGCGRNDEELEAARGIRTLLAFYGSTPAYRAVLEAEGWGDLQPELNVLSKRGRWAEMGELITDEMMETLGVLGSPARCAAQIVDRFGPHVARICAYFPGYGAGDDLIGEFVDALHVAASP